MELNVENSEQIRELLFRGEEEKLGGIRWLSETLSGAMHLACLEKEMILTLNDEHLFFRQLEGWSYLPLFQAARKAMNHLGLWALPLNMKAEAREWEILPIPSAPQTADIAWAQFNMRFGVSLRARGFSGKLPHALTGALSEMADNSLRHSGLSIQSPSFGAVGYFVEQGVMTFCVVDVGQGVLSSLQANSANSTLKSDSDALRAAVLKQATSDASKSLGNGFDEVHRALSDRNGRLRFRSGKAALDLDGRGDDRQIDFSHAMVPAAGFQLVVRCCLDSQIDDSDL